MAMSIHNIKSGFHKCGVIPFIQYAIDKQQLVQAKLIPDADVDLAVPPTHAYVHEASQTDEPTEVLPPLKGALQEQDNKDQDAGSRNEGENDPENDNTYEDNPLFKYGIVSKEVASVFYLPAEVILKGSKMPLRIKSKVWVLTSEEVRKDIADQAEAIQVLTFIEQGM